MSFTKQLFLIGALLTAGTMMAQPPGFNDDVNDEPTAPIPGIALAAVIGLGIGYKALHKKS